MTHCPVYLYKKVRVSIYLDQLSLNSNENRKNVYVVYVAIESSDSKTTARESLKVTSETDWHSSKGVLLLFHWNTKWSHTLLFLQYPKYSANTEIRNKPRLSSTGWTFWSGVFRFNHKSNVFWLALLSYLGDNLRSCSQLSFSTILPISLLTNPFNKHQLTHLTSCHQSACTIAFQMIISFRIGR